MMACLVSQRCKNLVKDQGLLSGKGMVRVAKVLSIVQGEPWITSGV